MIEVNDEITRAETPFFWARRAKIAKFAKNPFCNKLLYGTREPRALSPRPRNVAVAKLFPRRHLLLDLGPAAEEARETARALAGVLVHG